MTLYQSIYAALEGPVISTHSHHLKDHEMTGMTLHRMVQRTYVNWMAGGGLAEDTPEARAIFLEKLRPNSYAYWLKQALEAIYGEGEPLTLATWDAYDARIRAAYEDPEHHLRLLRDTCGYAAIVLDKYESPGCANGHPDLFRPTLRMDSLFHGYDRSKDHNGVAPQDHAFPVTDGMTLADYLAQFEPFIRRRMGEDPISALKIALAYERDLTFEPLDYAAAERAFLAEAPAPEDIRAFHAVVMDKIMQCAEAVGLPVQIHTGLASLRDTRAMELYPIISRYPNVKFDLFHASFPWTDDILALAHNYTHVYVDLCWLPLISTTRAITFIREALEVTDATRLIWGCDTWTSEESYGALLAARHTLSRALAAMVEDGCLTEAEACTLGRRILYDNAKALFGF